ncbi:unnamed protein product, partial [Prorocentrum cordatum]
GLPVGAASVRPGSPGEPEPTSAPRRFAALPTSVRQLVQDAFFGDDTTVAAVARQSRVSPQQLDCASLRSALRRQLRRELKRCRQGLRLKERLVRSMLPQEQAAALLAARAARGAARGARSSRAGQQLSEEQEEEREEARLRQRVAMLQQLLAFWRRRVEGAPAAARGFAAGCREEGDGGGEEEAGGGGGAASRRSRRSGVAGGRAGPRPGFVAVLDEQRPLEGDHDPPPLALEELLGGGVRVAGQPVLGYEELVDFIGNMVEIDNKVTPTNDDIHIAKDLNVKQLRKCQDALQAASKVEIAEDAMFMSVEVLPKGWSYDVEAMALNLDFEECYAAGELSERNMNAEDKAKFAEAKRAELQSIFDNQEAENIAKTAPLLMPLKYLQSNAASAGVGSLSIYSPLVYIAG